MAPGVTGTKKSKDAGKGDQPAAGHPGGAGPVERACIGG